MNSLLRTDKGKNKLVRSGWPKTDTETIPNVGKIRISKWILETDRGRTSQAENWLGNNSVVYYLNGQVQFREKGGYLDRLKLFNLEGSLLVAVDISEIPIEIRDQIFRVDRAFTEETDEANLLKEAVKQQIISDEDIRKANDAKFFEKAKDIGIDVKHTQRIIQKLSKENPLLRELLQGTELPIAAGNITLIKKKGKKYRNVKYGKKSPNFFQLKRNTKP